MLSIPQSNLYKNMTASKAVKSVPGTLAGIVINSHSSGTLKIWDNTSAAAPVINNTITLAADERYINFHNVAFKTGLYITIGGTADITVYYS